jgi:hypothetical protein
MGMRRHPGAALFASPSNCPLRPFPLNKATLAGDKSEINQKLLIENKST